MITLRSNRIFLTVIVLILIPIACRFGAPSEPTVENPQQQSEPTAQNPQQQSELTEPTVQSDSNFNTQSAPFEFIPYEIKEWTNDYVKPGFKYIDIYLAIKNTGTDWVYFDKIDSYKPMILKTNGGDYDSDKGNSTDDFLSAPGTTVTGINDDLFSLTFEIGATLHPISIEFQYDYKQIDSMGLPRPVPTPDPITLDLQNLGKLEDVPISQEMVISNLPITYEFPKGTAIINSANLDSANQDSYGIDVDISVTSSDPAQNIKARFTAAALTSEGIIDDYIFGDVFTGLTVGPMQTLNNKLVFPSIHQDQTPIYLLLYGISIEEDSQIVNQIMKIIP